MMSTFANAQWPIIQDTRFHVPKRGPLFRHPRRFPFLALSSKARTQIAAAAHTTTKQLGRGGKQTLPRKALTIHPGSLDSDLWDIDYPVRDCLDSLTASRARWRRQPTLFSIFTVRKGIDPSVPLALARPQYPD